MTTTGQPTTEPATGQPPGRQAAAHTLDTIENFCRIICYGVSSPFPRSQEQLGLAVVGLKSALKQLSPLELLDRSPTLIPVAEEFIRPQIKPIAALDSLLNQPGLARALPNLRQAVRFLHELDQQDVYGIIRLKLDLWATDDSPDHF